MIYTQHYNPFPSVILSTGIAALPVLVLFYLLVIKRVHVPWAAAGGAATAICMAVTVYGMPVHMAGLAFINGALFGLLPICWNIVNAMFLYNITVATGKFERVGTEANIFKFVVWHSVLLASIVGLIVLLQAYVYPFTAMVPH